MHAGDKDEVSPRHEKIYRGGPTLTRSDIKSKTMESVASFDDSDLLDQDLKQEESDSKLIKQTSLHNDITDFD